MLFLATHIGVWLLVAFAFGLGIGWFLWGRWVGIDMNRDFAHTSSGQESSGSIAVLSDSLLKTQRELEQCQKSLLEAESRIQVTDMRFEPAKKQLPLQDESDLEPLSLSNGEERDDLKKIYGIGPVIERKLAVLDIVSYRQIALLTEEEMVIVSDHINYFPGRIERDGWLESARDLHLDKYGEVIA